MVRLHRCAPIAPARLLAQPRVKRPRQAGLGLAVPAVASRRGQAVVLAPVPAGTSRPSVAGVGAAAPVSPLVLACTGGIGASVGSAGPSPSVSAGVASPPQAPFMSAGTVSSSVPALACAGRGRFPSPGVAGAPLSARWEAFWNIITAFERSSSAGVVDLMSALGADRQCTSRNKDGAPPGVVLGALAEAKVAGVNVRALADGIIERRFMRKVTCSSAQT